jgi:hypothetical protein
MEILDPDHRYAIWTSESGRSIYLKNVSSHNNMIGIYKGGDIEYSTNYDTVFIKYEDAMFLYNTKDEDILRLFIISLINKIKNNDY